jgi:hypothetical protein
VPLQNRINPWGEIEAVAARGTMLGNRGGKFHRDDQTLGRRRWASIHWIACELHYKDMHHEPMGRGYTSLFFLDEVTALAAGHRPCFFCRRAEAKAFLAGQRVPDFDRALHDQRSRRHEAEIRGLPDGAMIAEGGTAYAIRGGGLLPWSYTGYGRPVPRADIGQVRLLTPPLIVEILARGYTPRWHSSAEIREEP